MVIAWAGTLAGPFMAWWLWRRPGLGARVLLVLLATAYVLAVWAGR